jgi:hypothetical protein
MTGGGAGMTGTTAFNVGTAVAGPVRREFARKVVRRRGDGGPDGWGLGRKGR